MDNNNEFKKVSTNSTISTNRRKYFVTSVIVGQRKFSLAIPAEKKPVWDAFKRLAEMERCSAGKLLEVAVEEYVARHSPGNPQLPLTKFTGVQIPATGTELEAQVFRAKVKMPRKDSLGRQIQEERTIQVSEKDLLQVAEQWQDLSERGKRSWIQILEQINYPTAREILRYASGEVKH